MERTIFTPEMLTRHNFGLFIIKLTASEDIRENVGFNSTVSFKLGYQMSTKIKKYGRTNFLTDGWFCDLADTIEELCDILNNDPWGYRLLTKEEVIYMIDQREQGFL
jgi:hypothetical protein